jgi:hypothetical protein
MTGTLVWAPERLTAAIERAYLESLVRAEADAKAHSPDPDKAGVRLEGNTLVPSGLGTVFEEGRQGGYEIKPKGQALKLPGGQFAAVVRGGAMAPKPFIHPAAARWANGGFQSTARATLASQGF